MLILILLIITLVLLSYIVSNADILNPVFICVSVFMLSVFAAFYNVEYWGIDLASETVALIILSLLSMIIFGTLALYTNFRIPRIQLNIGRRKEVREISYIDVDLYKIVIVLLLGVISTYFYLNDVVRIASASGYVTGSGITALLTYYRQAAHFNSTDLDNSLSRLSSYTMEIYKVLSYVSTYVGLNNFVFNRKSNSKSSLLKFFAPTMLYAITSILSGGRMRILQLMIYIIIIYFILLKRASGWKKTFGVGTIMKLIAIIIAVLAGFVAIRGFIGRETDSDPLRYITAYLGGSIELLDLFIKKPVTSSDVWGKETFYSIYNYFGRHFNISDWTYVFAKEFRNSTTGVNVGNVYTALRCFYYDFGFWGCVFMSGVVGFIYTKLYKRLFYKKVYHIVDMGVIAYAYIFYAIAMFGINFYFDFLSFSYLKTIVFFYAARWFLVDFKCVSFTGKVTRKDLYLRL